MSRTGPTRKRRQSKRRPTLKNAGSFGDKERIEPGLKPGSHLQGKTASSSIQEHAALLSNPQVKPVQRQQLARQISQTMGNKYLHRVMVQMKEENGHQRTGLCQQAGFSKSGPASVTYRELDNGEVEQAVQIPFTQVVARDADDSEALTEERQPEESIHVDEILGEEEEFDEPKEEDSSVSANVNYTTTVAQGGAGPGGFGVTRSRASWQNVDISSSFGTIFNSGTYTVRGNFDYRVRWQVRSNTGPGGQVNITSDSDPDIRPHNYQYIAKDLIPNMGDLNGRPPRAGYWSSDITAQHELYHADDRSTFGSDGATAAQAWLNAQRATSASNVRNTLLPQALDEGKRAINTRMNAPPGKEQRAYGDGAPAYQSRSDSIKAKGDAGDYGRISARVRVHPIGGDTYEIVAGDTLSSIAERVYGDASLWREIYRANPGKSSQGGDLIYPGTVLDLPLINADQELLLLLSMGDAFVFTDQVVVAAGTTHEFQVEAKDLLDDTVDSSGTIVIDVASGEGEILNTTNWNLPGSTRHREGHIEVSARFTG